MADRELNVDEALEQLKNTPTWTKERAAAVFALHDAYRQERARLRAAPAPLTKCQVCDRELDAGEPVVVQRGFGRKKRIHFVCQTCQEQERLRMQEYYRELWEKPDHIEPPEELEDIPCPTCNRSMLYTWRAARYPTPCSYQCSYRRQIRRQLEARKVKHGSMDCLVCGKSFIPRRSDATTCSNTCRQRAFRQRSAQNLQE